MEDIFLGGTGFMGKALVEKLLRSCSGVSTIYLLVRPKKGNNITDRIDNLFNDPVKKFHISHQINYFIITDEFSCLRSLAV